MKIRFMKKEALVFFKKNISQIYHHYYQNSTNEWMSDEYGSEVFESFIEIPDFELSSLYGQSAGEIDLENCIIIYSNLIMLSESQASDERLWAGLCNDVFYDYMRRRFGYDNYQMKEIEAEITGIISRFFFASPGRAGFFRNTLSKCWWVGRLVYDAGSVNKFEKLSILGSSDFSSKISDIFYSNSFTSNPKIVDGICNAIKYYRDKDIILTDKEYIRPAMQYLNAVGGGTLLDLYSEDEIKNIVIKRIYEIAKEKNKGTAWLINDVDIDYQLGEEEGSDEIDGLEDLIIGDYVDETEMPTIDYVTYGSLIRIMVKENNQIIEKKLPSQEEFQRDGIIEFLNRFLGKTVGYVVYISGKHYELIEIAN